MAKSSARPRTTPEPTSAPASMPPTPAGNAVQSPAGAPSRQGPTHEQIARRAYELFLARGGGHGHHDEDWLQAERELRLNRR